MLKIYTLFTLVGSLLAMQTNQALSSAACLHAYEDYAAANPFVKQGSLPSQTVGTINFKAFQDKDPYELEEEHQAFFKEQQFNKAAIALIGSAINGDSDNMDYLLKVDANAPKYIYDNDSKNTQNLIRKIVKDLAKQYKISQKAPLSLQLPSTEDIQLEALQKQK